MCPSLSLLLALLALRDAAALDLPDLVADLVHELAGVRDHLEVISCPIHKYLHKNHAIHISHIISHFLFHIVFLCLLDLQESICIEER